VNVISDNLTKVLIANILTKEEFNNQTHGNALALNQFVDPISYPLAGQRLTHQDVILQIATIILATLYGIINTYLSIE
jgi:hypothetical protein